MHLSFNIWISARGHPVFSNSKCYYSCQASFVQVFSYTQVTQCLLYLLKEKMIQYYICKTAMVYNILHSEWGGNFYGVEVKVSLMNCYLTTGRSSQSKGICVNLKITTKNNLGNVPLAFKSMYSNFITCCLFSPFLLIKTHSWLIFSSTGTTSYNRPRF